MLGKTNCERNGCLIVQPSKFLGLLSLAFQWNIAPGFWHEYDQAPVSNSRSRPTFESIVTIFYHLKELQINWQWWNQLLAGDLHTIGWSSFQAGKAKTWSIQWEKNVPGLRFPAMIIMVVDATAVECTNEHALPYWPTYQYYDHLDLHHVHCSSNKWEMRKKNNDFFSPSLPSSTLSRSSLAMVSGKDKNSPLNASFLSKSRLDLSLSISGMEETAKFGFMFLELPQIYAWKYSVQCPSYLLPSSLSLSLSLLAWPLVGDGGGGCSLKTTKFLSNWKPEIVIWVPIFMDYEIW